MKIIYTNINGNIDCEVFNKEIEYGTCAQCKYNLLGDFVKKQTCSACLAQTGPQVKIYYSSPYGNVPSTKTVNKGYVLKANDLLPLTTTGYQFTGWDHEIGDVIDEDTTISASWVKLHQIIYHTEHGTTPTHPDVITGYTFTNDDLPELQAIGYNFNGWCFNNDPSAKATIGYIVKDEDNNIDLYAVWLDNNLSFTIINAANGSEFLAPDA